MPGSTVPAEEGAELVKASLPKSDTKAVVMVLPVMGKLPETLPEAKVMLVAAANEKFMVLPAATLFLRSNFKVISENKRFGTSGLRGFYEMLNNGIQNLIFPVVLCVHSVPSGQRNITCQSIKGKNLQVRRAKQHQLLICHLFAIISPL